MLNFDCISLRSIVRLLAILACPIPQSPYFCIPLLVQVSTSPNWFKGTLAEHPLFNCLRQARRPWRGGPKGVLHSRWKPEREAEEKKRRGRRRRRRRRRQSRKTEAACVASADRNNLLTVYAIYEISTAPSKVAPAIVYEPLAWQQTAAGKGTEWKRREIASREVDVHARWKTEREAEDKRRRRGRRGIIRDEDKTVDQKQLE